MFVTILSYCDTEVKKNQLRELLISVRQKYPDWKILVYSHYLNVEPEYYSIADYYIFDKSNPKSLRLLIDWTIIPTQQKKFHRAGFGWGYAVLQMIKRSIIYLKGIGVEESFFLNYDCDPEDIFKLETISNLNLNNDYFGVFSNWDSIIQSFSLVDFYIRIDKISDEFLNTINEEYYNSMPHSVIPEEFWRNIIVDILGDSYLIHNLKIKSKISLASRALPPEASLRNYFDTILPTTDDVTKEKCLAIWNCKIPINKLTVNINGIEEVYDSEIPEESRFHSFFCTLNQSDISSITVIGINGESIEPYTLDGLSDEYWSYNFHTKNI
jgi:hypothetical protein